MDDRLKGLVIFLVLLLPALLVAAAGIISLLDRRRPSAADAGETVSPAEPSSGPPTLDYRTPGSEPRRWPALVHIVFWTLGVWPYAVVALMLVAATDARIQLGHWPDGGSPYGHWYLSRIGHRAMHWGTNGFIGLMPGQFLALVVGLIHLKTTTRRRERNFAWLLIASAVGWAACLGAVALTGFMYLLFD